MGVRRELRYKFIAALHGKPPWLSKAFGNTAWEIQHDDAFGSGNFVYEFLDTHPREWTRQGLITLCKTAEEYMVEVLAKSHCDKQQQISCRFSTCLLLWQGKEVVYSWNSRTCSCR